VRRKQVRHGPVRYRADEELIFALAMPGSRRVQIRGDVPPEIEPS